MESDALERLKQNAICCACGAGLANSRRPTIVTLAREATWDFPTCGNVHFQSQPRRASAVVCDECASHAERIGQFDPPITWAIELDGSLIHYHPVDKLRELPPEPTYVIRKGRLNWPCITCLRCGVTSYNPDDIANRYCGCCHRFHDPL